MSSVISCLPYGITWYRLLMFFRQCFASDGYGTLLIRSIADIFAAFPRRPKRYPCKIRIQSVRMMAVLQSKYHSSELRFFRPIYILLPDQSVHLHSQTRVTMFQQLSQTVNSWQSFLNPSNVNTKKVHSGVHCYKNCSCSCIAEQAWETRGGLARKRFI